MDVNILKPFFGRSDDPALIRHMFVFQSGFGQKPIGKFKDQVGQAVLDGESDDDQRAGLCHPGDFIKRLFQIPDVLKHTHRNDPVKHLGMIGQSESRPFAQMGGNIFLGRHPFHQMHAAMKIDGMQGFALGLELFQKYPGPASQIQQTIKPARRKQRRNRFEPPDVEGSGQRQIVELQRIGDFRRADILSSWKTHVLALSILSVDLEQPDRQSFNGINLYDIRILHDLRIGSLKKTQFLLVVAVPKKQMRHGKSVEGI
ncbi:MAG: hypothetical protein WBC70_18595, partial [Candidatus Aminicenantales bacterium]